MSDIDDLLAAERARPGYTDEAKAEMWSGIEKSIAMGAAAGVAAGAGAKAAAKIATWKIGAVGVAALAVGVGAGAAGHAHFAEPRVVTVEKIVTTTTTVTVVTPAPPPPAASAAPAPTVHAVAPTPAASTPPAKDPDLARERTLLDMARTALGRGDTSSALAALEQAKELPRSQLAEEREVLAVQALASAGRRDEATRRAAAFHTKFPKSALGAVVDDAVK